MLRAGWNCAVGSDILPCLLFNIFISELEEGGNNTLISGDINWEMFHKPGRIEIIPRDVKRLEL